MKAHPVSHNMAKKAMLMATLMLNTTETAKFVMDGRDGLWEIACAPHSWLSEACDREGLQPHRVNLEQGYDLYKPASWQRLREEYRLWFSLPCTKWCPWNRLNYRTPERRELLEEYRRRERRVLKQANAFIKDCLKVDPDVLIYWEWPVQCEGWNESTLLDLKRHMDTNFIPWNPCRIDGCVYDVRTTTGEFLRKKWRIQTNDESFWHSYRCKVCCAQHPHGEIAGQETAKTAYYPWKMSPPLHVFGVVKKLDFGNFVVQQPSRTPTTWKRRWTFFLLLYPYQYLGLQSYLLLYPLLLHR